MTAPRSLLLSLSLMAVGCSYEVDLGPTRPAVAAAPAPSAPIAPAVDGCLITEPARLDFGAVALGRREVVELKIRNVCATELGLESVEVAGAGFGLDDGSAGGVVVPGAAARPARLPLGVVIAPGADYPVSVAFRPVDDRPSWGQLEVTPSERPTAVVPLLANVDRPCVVVEPELDFGCVLLGRKAGAVVRLKAACNQAVEITGLELSGDNAYQLQGGPAPGLLAAGEQNDVVLGYAPIAERDDAGGPVPDLATLRVTSTDPSGAQAVSIRGFGRQRSCEAIAVEVQWRSSDGASVPARSSLLGPDLDVHLRHPLAPDWFDVPLDAYWRNRTPDWGTIGETRDDPEVSPDAYGDGPERIVLRDPEPGAEYRVGVHYWAANDPGGSVRADVAVYVWGRLAHERKAVRLDEHDLWDAAVIRWPLGKASAVPDDAGVGLPRIVPGVDPCVSDLCDGKP